MARTVDDIALILDATAGYDPADPTTTASGGKMPRTYTSALKQGALKGARIGVLTEFFGNAPEDEEVALVVRRAIDEMKALGATPIDVAVPDLARLITSSNLLTQELKFYLGDYLRNAGAHVTSIEAMLESGLHSASIQGILDVANRTAENYLSSEDYTNRLAARDALGKAMVTAMDADRLDVIVYPTIRRIAPLLGGNQAGSNAALSANSGFPAISVPAGFTPGGFPVGLELFGRPFAESTLLALAFDFEQATHHRRPPSLMVTSDPRDPLVGNVGPERFQVTATGTHSVPPSKVPFECVAMCSVNEQTREIGFDIRLSGTIADVAGVYLHRRADRSNGGVAYILAKTAAPLISTRVTLTAAEFTDLKAGKLYLSVITKRNPRLSARADLVLPPV
jgi:hypothetical protein